MEITTMSQQAATKTQATNAVLHLPDGQSIELPVITGSENEKAIELCTDVLEKA